MPATATQRPRSNPRRHCAYTAIQQCRSTWPAACPGLGETRCPSPDACAARRAAITDGLSETPLHPARSFTGRDQVRRNQQKIFTFVPDLTAELLGSAVDGTTIWTEWEHRGTRRNGAPHHMRGPIILGMRDELACGGRFYLEPVEAEVTTLTLRYTATLPDLPALDLTADCSV
jgi:hypothetical protein